MTGTQSVTVPPACATRVQRIASSKHRSECGSIGESSQAPGVNEQAAQTVSRADRPQAAWGCEEPLSSTAKKCHLYQSRFLGRGGHEFFLFFKKMLPRPFCEPMNR